MSVVMDVSTCERSQEVLRLLREQASLFARLEGYADRQRSLVADEDARPLLALLADRQRLSAELTRIASRLSGVRREWAAIRGVMTAADRAEADGLVEDAQRRLWRVIEGDEKDARLLSLRKRVTGTTLQTVEAAGSAIRGYKSQVLPASGMGRLDEAS